MSAQRLLLPVRFGADFVAGGGVGAEGCWEAGEVAEELLCLGVGGHVLYLLALVAMAEDGIEDDAFLAFGAAGALGLGEEVLTHVEDDLPFLGEAEGGLEPVEFGIGDGVDVEVVGKLGRLLGMGGDYLLLDGLLLDYLLLHYLCLDEGAVGGVVDFHGGFGLRLFKIVQDCSRLFKGGSRWFKFEQRSVELF